MLFSWIIMQLVKCAAWPFRRMGEYFRWRAYRIEAINWEINSEAENITSIMDWELDRLELLQKSREEAKEA
jgi:hypothetical protein